MSKCKVNSNSRWTGGQRFAVSGVYSWGYLFSFMVILRFKPASWNLTAERTIMNGSCASGTDRFEKCFHVTVHLGCVCLRCIPECQDALFRDWGFKSSRDILRRFLNPRSPVKNLCFPVVCQACCFQSKTQQMYLGFKENDGFFFLF